MTKHRKSTVTKTDWSGFKKRCKENNIIFSTAYSYWQCHPELSEDEVFGYYRNGKTDFKAIQKLCREKGICYKSFLNLRRSESARGLTFDEQVSLYAAHQETQLPKIKPGDRFRNTYGLWMEITAYRTADDVDVRFEIDGTEVCHKRLKNIQQGRIGHPVYNRQYFTNKKYAEERVGQTRTMNNGMEATIIAYRARNDITIRFADGTEVNSTYGQFLRGAISYPGIRTYDILSARDGEKRIGQQRKNSDGHMMELIAYKNSEDVDVRRDDGLISEHRTYQNFDRGQILFLEDHTGEKYMATNGMWMEIIRSEHGGWKVDVRFEDGVVRKDRGYGAVILGNVAHPSLPSQKHATNFHGFKAQRVTKTETQVFYKCECNICRKKEVMTPQQMIEHAKLHEGRKEEHVKTQKP